MTRAESGNLLDGEGAIGMVKVELTGEEAALLKHSLEWLLSDVRMEMCDTDRADFREGLKKEKGVLESVIAQLDETVGE